jgi:hypothetical protein
MPEPGYVPVGSIILGILLAACSPYLSKIRIFLPPPRSHPARVASIVAEEALACILIVSGTNGLITDSPISGLLQTIATLAVIAVILAVIVGMFVEAQHKAEHPPDTNLPS